MKTFEDLLAAWIAAEAEGCAAALDPLLAPDFSGDGPAGYVLAKEQWIDRHASRDLVVDAFTWECTDLRHHGSTAVAVGVMSQAARYRGEDCGGDFVCSLVAVCRGERWMVVNVQFRRA
jgi:hypothetical protein